MWISIQIPQQRKNCKRDQYGELNPVRPSIWYGSAKVYSGYSQLTHLLRAYHNQPALRCHPTTKSCGVRTQKWTREARTGECSSSRWRLSPAKRFKQSWLIKNSKLQCLTPLNKPMLLQFFYQTPELRCSHKVCICIILFTFKLTFVVFQVFCCRCVFVAAASVVTAGVVSAGCTCACACATRRQSCTADGANYFQAAKHRKSSTGKSRAFHHWTWKNQKPSAANQPKNSSSHQVAREKKQS